MSTPITRDPTGRRGTTGMGRPVADYDRMVDDLAYRYDGVFSREGVAQAIQEARAHLEPISKVADHLLVLTERFVRERLLAAGQSQGPVATEIPEILFVCVRNAGRSQLAAALAKHLSGGHVHVRSAGSAPTGEIHPLGPTGPARTRHRRLRGLSETIDRRRGSRRELHHHDGLR